MTNTLTYPALLIITNIGGKIRALDSVTNMDCTNQVYYITLHNAYKKNRNLYKKSADSKFQSVDASFTLDDKLITSKKSAAEIKNVVADDVPIWDSITRPTNKELIISPIKWKYILRSIFRSKNILITGPTGCGKTKAAFAAAKALDYNIAYFNLGSTQDPRSTLIGNTHYSNDRGGTFFNESEFVHALRTPKTAIILDEVSRAHPDAWNILMSVLDQNLRHLRLDEAVDSPTVKVAENVAFIATANIGNEYTATRVVDRAFDDRFITFEMDVLSKDQECAWVRSIFPNLSETIVHNITSISADIRKECSSDSPKISTYISTRVVGELAGLVADGFTLLEAIEVTIYPFYSETGGIDSERTFVKQLIQKYVTI